MPVTIQPTTLKYKTGNGQYQSADCLKGDKGDKGDKGEAGIHYGTTAPTDPDISVWIDPSGTADSMVTDVQVNGTSVTSNGVANVPIANSNDFGVVKVGDGLGINGTTNKLQINSASTSTVKGGAAGYAPLVPGHQHEATFYGLAKAAGQDMKNSDNAVGTYTTEAKAAIQTMLGVPGDVQVNGTSVVSNGVANVPMAGTDPGVVKINSGYGIYLYEGALRTSLPSLAQIQAGNNNTLPLTVNNQHNATFFGLAKASGDTTQSSSANAVGVYTPEAKAAIWQMLGLDGSAFVKSDWELIREDTFTNATEADHIITVDGNGNAFELTDVAIWFELPNDENASSKLEYGRFRFIYDSNDTSKAIITENGNMTRNAGASAYGTTALVEQKQGLVFATRSLAATSTNTGTLGWRFHPSVSTSNGIFMPTSYPLIFCKINISAVTGKAHYKLYGKRKRAALDSPVINVSGTTPTITALPGHRYICGECSTLTITVPTSGCIDVVFESGSTATVLTVTPTKTGVTAVKWANGFNPTSLDANTRYEVLIEDGEYGMVASWT